MNVVGPLPHQHPPFLEQVTPGVSLLDGVAQLVRQGCLQNRGRRIALLAMVSPDWPKAGD